MLRRFSVNFAIFSMAMDALLVAAMLRLAGQLRPHLGAWMQWLPLVRDVLQPMESPPALYVIFPLIWVLISASFSLYDGEKNISAVDEFFVLTLSAALAGVTLAGVLYLSYRETSRVLFVFFVLFTYLGMVLWRIPARWLYRRRYLSRKRIARVLIVGAGPVGRDVQSQLQMQSQLPVQVVGFLDDDPQKRARHEDILGSLDQVREVVAQARVQHIVLALPLRAHGRINQIATDLWDMPVQIWVIPDYFHLVLHHAEMRELGNIPMLNLRAPALSGHQRLAKRLFDLVIGSLLLIFALPLMILIAALIWLDDGRPILFRQQRVGENGRIFTVYKFRTMVKNAEALRHLVEEVDEHGNLIHKRPDDPRVTRVGRFLRRFSLDELPQLFNVLRGEMSLVGPRPELPYLVEKYQPWQRKRFAVPQGITGWWQIHGRSDRPMHLHTEDDLYYIQNYSIWLDMQILLKTFWIVLRRKGAY